jgi:hypothetical protein
MGKELVVAEFAEEQTAGEAEGALESDSFIDVEIVEEGGELEMTLGEADAAALEAGIASVFDSLMAEAAENDESESDEAGAADHTFVLLEELNRLWAQAA